MIETEAPGHGQFRIPGLAVRMSDNHVDYRVAEPLGESNGEVYGSILGKSEEELERLRKDGII